MKSPKNPKLLPITISPCPFCGSKWPKITTPGAGGIRRVYCVRESCYSSGPIRKTEHGAIIAWNRAVGGGK